MSEARNHHFVPQGYLRGFSHGVKRQAQLFVVDRIKRKAYTSAVRNVAGQRDFNRVEIEGVGPNDVEHFYAKIEGEVALAIKRIAAEESLTRPNTQDLETVVTMIMILAIRNPRLRGNMASSLSGLYKRIMDISLSSKDRWEAVTRRMEREGYATKGNVTYEQLREFVDRGEYDILTTTTGHASMEIRSYTKLIHVFGNRRWTLFKAAPEAGDFITSDHPVCLFDKRQPTAYSPIGYGTRETVLIFPVTRRLLLWGEFEDGDETTLEMPPDLVWQMNSRIASYATRQVYAADNTPRYLSKPNVKAIPSLLKEGWFVNV
ncbi:hypothetical protein J2X72_001255 [Phyllobacterium sp. 1468]|uniref:DUF4238 domain-containing protein n=1 Tax=Phyllobacterium sp. 1468 TaxID=2817759 RepID=UPI0028678B28|nr:DUF4238 domain-containing protein [Phyllobacterium sp. 1468]MDR6632471.1 hypothetical protein [Phyllobacterium sp. 1468]